MDLSNEKWQCVVVGYNEMAALETGGAFVTIAEDVF
jgi:hypothetical protein